MVEKRGSGAEDPGSESPANRAPGHKTTELAGQSVGEKLVSIRKYAEDNQLGYETVRRLVVGGSLRSVEVGGRQFVVVVDQEFSTLRNTRAELARVQDQLRAALEDYDQLLVKRVEGAKAVRQNEEDLAKVRLENDQVREELTRLQQERDQVRADVEVIRADYTALREENEALAIKTDKEGVDWLKKRLVVKPDLLGEITGPGGEQLADGGSVPVPIERIMAILKEVLGAPGLRELGDWVKDPRRLAAAYARYLESFDMTPAEHELSKVGKVSGDQVFLIGKLFAKWREEGVPSYVVDLRSARETESRETRSKP